MPIRINVVGLGPIEFPDGTPDAEMESALKQLEAPAPASPAAPRAELRATTPEPMYRRAYEAVRETLSPLLGPTARQVARDSIEWGGQRLYKPLGSEIEQKGFFPALSKPAVETPKFQQTSEDGWITGTGKAVANTGLGFVDFATSPLGFATMAAGGPVAGAAPKATGQAIHRGVAGAFGADLLLKSPEAIGQAVDVARDPNAVLGQKIEAGVGAGANLALGAFLGAKGAGLPRARVSAEARALEGELGGKAESGKQKAEMLQLPERTGAIITPPPRPTFDRLRQTLGTVEEQLREAALLRDEGDFTTEARRTQEISDEAQASPAAAELRTGEPIYEEAQGQTLLDQRTTEARRTPSLQNPDAGLVDSGPANLPRRATLADLGLPAPDALDATLPSLDLPPALLSPSEYWKAAAESGPARSGGAVLEMARRNIRNLYGRYQTKNRGVWANPLGGHDDPATVRKAHAMQIRLAMRSGADVNAEAVGAYGLTEAAAAAGYERIGDIYARRDAPAQAQNSNAGVVRRTPSAPEASGALSRNPVQLPASPVETPAAPAPNEPSQKAIATDQIPASESAVESSRAQANASRNPQVETTPEQIAVKFADQYDGGANSFGVAASPAPKTEPPMAPQEKAGKSDTPGLTPMMQQYQKIKAGLGEKHGDALLAFRLGDFYEFFFEDAKAAAALAGNERSLAKRNGVDMWGIPVHAARGYFEKMLAGGRKVAVVDQTESPVPGKLTERKVTEVLQPEKAKKAATPAKAQAKMQEQVSEVAKTEGTRPAREVKSELVGRLEELVSKVPEPEFKSSTLKTYNGKRRFTVSLGDEFVEVREGFSDNWTLGQYDIDGKTGKTKEKILHTFKAWTPGEALNEAKVFLEEKVFPERTQTIDVDIPGDGKFKIKQTFYALSKTLARAKALETSTAAEKEPMRNNVTKAEAEALRNEMRVTGSEKEDLLAKLEAMKQGAGGEQMAALIPGLDPATFRAMRNTALDVAIGAIKAGRAIREAAEAGWQNLKAALDKLGLKYDAAQLRAEFVQALTESDARVGLSQRGTGLLGDENLSQAARSGMNPAYERRSNEADQEFARRIIAGAGGPERAAQAWLAGEFRGEPGAVQTIIGTEAQRQLGLLEAVKRRSGDTAAADGIVELQRTLANADMQRATELGQAVQAFAVHYGNWSPAAWVKDFREKVGKLAAERVDRGRSEVGGSRIEDGGRTEATPTGIAQGVAEGVADKVEAEGNPKLGKTIREHWGKAESGKQKAETGRAPKTLEERLAEAGAKKPKETARKVQGFYEKEVRDWRRKHKIPEFDAETEREIIREANRIEQLPPDSIQRREAAIRLHDRIARMKGFEWWELPLDFWYANILSGFTTHARNVIGNSVNLGAESAVMMLRNPTAIPQILEALGRAVPKSSREAWNVLRTGRDTAGREHGSKFDAPGVLERVANPVASKVLLPWKLVGRLLRAEDLAAFYPLQEARAVVLARQRAAKDGIPIWKRAEAARSVLGWTAEAQARARAQARGEGLAPGGLLFERRVSELLENQRPELLMRNAREFAFDGTFNNDPYGLIGAVADGIKNASLREPALKFVVPFTRIVANVSNSMMNWTPVGFWRAGRAKGYKLLIGKEANTGKLFGREVTDPQAIGDEFTRATLGSTALMAVAAAAAASIYDRNPKFAVTGGGPSDPEQKQLLRATGWIPYSVKVGDRYVSYQNTTAGLGLGIVGAYMDAVRYRNLDEQDALNRAAFALGSGFNVVLNSSFLSGLASLFNQASETGTKHPVKGVPATAIRTATSLAVPNAVKQVDQLFDPTRYSADDVRSMMLGQVPFARRAEQPDLNVFGEPVSSPLSKMFTSTAEGDLLTRTLAGRRLWPSVPAESGLTADEHYTVMKLRGPMLRAALTAQLGEITSLPRADAQALVSRISAEQTREAMATLGLDNVAKLRREVQRGSRK